MASQTKLYLCLDQGGHASRALVLDQQGAVVARAARDVATQHPAPDCVEQNPEEIVASLIEAAREVGDTLGPRAVKLSAAGLATQRSSIVCWDRETGQALAPVISWQDRRAHAWLGQFTPQSQEIERRTGLRLSAHYGASKLRWCLEHLEPVRIAQRAGRLAMGPLASFLAFRLFEERPFVADPSNAQRTLLWNLATRDWDPWLLELFGVPPDVLPICVPTRHAFGCLKLGDRALPATIVTGDQAAALFTAGIPRVDFAYVNLGTGAFVQRVVHEPHRFPGLLTSSAYYESTSASYDEGSNAIYTVEGTVNGAGAALAWAAQTFELSELDAALSEWLARKIEPPLFLNGIGGLGAPYWIADFPSRFIGAGAPWQKAVAVAESIVFSLAVNLERMRTTGTELSMLVLTGGLAASDGLCQRLVDLTGLPAWRPEEHEATARGLAWLLAERPPRWRSVGDTRFSPAPNPMLSRRYLRWCAEMDKALR